MDNPRSNAWECVAHIASVVTLAFVVWVLFG